MSLQLGIARVVYNGICFQNKYYSCHTAIKECWYELAWVYGDWDIEIYYDLCSPWSIYLYNGKTGEKEVCNQIVREQVSGQKLEIYFRSIQQLKVKQRRKKKRSSAML